MKRSGRMTCGEVIVCGLIMLGLFAALSFVVPFIRDYANSLRGEKVDLRGPAPRPGDVLHRTSRSEFELADAKISTSDASEEEITITAVDGRAVTKFKTKHVKDSSTKHLAGVASDEEAPFAGCTVVSEKVGGLWRHSLAEGQANEKQKEALGKEVGWDDEDDMPAGEQAVGCSWDESAGSWKRLLGPDSSAKSASGTIRDTFVRIENYRGERCAVIEGKGQVAIETNDGTMTADISSTTYRSLESGYEVKETHDWQVVLKTGMGAEVKGRLRNDTKTEVSR